MPFKNVQEKIYQKTITNYKNSALVRISFSSSCFASWSFYRNAIIWFESIEQSDHQNFFSMPDNTHDLINFFE